MSKKRFASYALSLAIGSALLGFTAGEALTQNAAAPPTVPAGPTCDVNETSPSELQRAFLSLQNMGADTTVPGRLRLAKVVITSATTNIERGQNMAGRNYLMAKTLYSLAMLPGFPHTSTRGDLGFPTMPTQEVDIIVALDSLLSSVEASNPNCADEIMIYRFSPIWVDLLTKATQMLQEDKVDSSEKLVLRAQILEDKSPYTWQMLASIATRRDQPQKSLELWKKVYDAAGTDTSVTDMKMQALYFLGEVNLGLASDTTKSAAERKAAATESVKWFKQYLVEGPKHKDSPAARNNLVQALTAAGDTASIPTVYIPLLEKPTEYTSADHLQAGVAAATAGRNEDAVKLFGNALASSPFDRDALYNLSVSMFSAKMYAQMAGPATRLVEVDPNNPDNYELLVYAYAMLDQEEKTDLAKKKLYSDSLEKYNKPYEALKESHRVTYDIFHREVNAAALTGFVENLGTTDRTFKLVFDFLNKDNAVIGQAETTVGPVKAKEKTTFSVKLDAGGVTAFKAKPIPPPQP